MVLYTIDWFWIVVIEYVHGWHKGTMYCIPICGFEHVQMDPQPHCQYCMCIWWIWIVIKGMAYITVTWKQPRYDDLVAFWIGCNNILLWVYMGRTWIVSYNDICLSLTLAIKLNVNMIWHYNHTSTTSTILTFPNEFGLMLLSLQINYLMKTYPF
jgi:hypothetical protein